MRRERGGEGRGRSRAYVGAAAMDGGRGEGKRRRPREEGTRRRESRSIPAYAGESAAGSWSIQSCAGEAAAAAMDGGGERKNNLNLDRAVPVFFFLLTIATPGPLGWQAKSLTCHFITDGQIEMVLHRMVLEYSGSRKSCLSRHQWPTILIA